ncbi:GDSL-type esterase/lipase family protein [Pseudalkalibacillus salsuginis]|uniref:GDSL-type esterase/lipase family protein n=1 Tax=Pseudalkalibacillus salsuginis TaxID=2910972 RepID=UPI001F15FBFD|nr:GDSL-type esterase/lipase family protein [Pseudalkalibacillus salsuginis]MCF6408892.1 GDSL-type esterase/lipase family protein [Pseudalkalibacillus salsuginis]
MQGKIFKNLLWLTLVIGIIIAINYIDDLISPPVVQDRNAIQIVAIGDSLTYGSGDPKKVGYIGRVYQQMTNSFGSQVVLHRYGVRGYRTDQIMIHIQNIEIKQKINQANYIFLFIGTNDFIQAARRDLNSINAEEMERKRPLFEENLAKLITQIRTDNQYAPLILIGMYDPYTDLVNHDQLNEILREWNLVTKGMVDQYPNIHYISTIDLFLDKEKTRYFNDIIHPNPKGYELIAKRVMDEMKRKGLIN